MKNNFDFKFALPGTQGETGEFDGGDSAAILGNLWATAPQITTVLITAPEHAVQASLNSESQTVVKLAQTIPWHVETDVPLRHPDTGKWYGQPDRFSRDQLVAVLCGVMAKLAHGTEMYRQATKLARAHAKRGFVFAWNTRKNSAQATNWKLPDICGPEVWALWLRILCVTKLKNFFLLRSLAVGLLCVLDLETVLGALDWRFRRRDRVCRNFLLVLGTQKIVATPTLALATKISDVAELHKRWYSHCQDVGEFYAF